MEFRLDEAQLDLQQTVGRFLRDHLSLDDIVTRESIPFDTRLWRDLAALGVLGLLAPEDAGGSGLGLVEAVLVFEQIGSHLVPGPLLWSVLAAPLLDRVATGEVVVGGTTTGLVNRSVVIGHVEAVDCILLVHADRVVVVRCDGSTAREPLDSLDPLTPAGRCGDLGDGDVIGGPAEAQILWQRGTVLSAALLAGIASRAIDVASTYALEREQFGVPIGSFQAIKHLLADMYLRANLAQSATYAAAAVVQDPAADDPGRAARIAKLLAADAAIDNASAAVQVLGGMGFTWAMLPNFLLKRAWVVEQDFDVADEHAGALGAMLVSR